MKVVIFPHSWEKEYVMKIWKTWWATIDYYYPIFIYKLYFNIFYMQRLLITPFHIFKFTKMTLSTKKSGCGNVGGIWVPDVAIIPTFNLQIPRNGNAVKDFSISYAGHSTKQWNYCQILLDVPILYIVVNA